MRRRSDGAGEWARRYRVYGLLALVLVAMAVLAPRFLSADNQISLLKTASIRVLPAIGFTFVLAAGQLDLSFAALMTLGGMLTMGFQPRFGWAGGAAIGAAIGCAVGVINGLLVAKAKVNSFIVTLSTMTIIQGIVNIYCHGNTLSVDDYSLFQWLDKRSFLAPPILFALSMVVVFEFVLHRTTFGKNLLLTGGNPAAAWHAGLKTAFTVVSAFALSGLLAGLGGSIAAMLSVSATPQMGNESLIIVVAAVIVGGTSMQGGRGTVLGSVAAVLMLSAIGNGLSLRGMDQEVTLIVEGLVLGVLVLAEALTANRRALLKGQRLDLLEEMWEERHRPGATG